MNLWYIQKAILTLPYIWVHWSSFSVSVFPFFGKEGGCWPRANLVPFSTQNTLDYKLLPSLENWNGQKWEIQSPSDRENDRFDGYSENQESRPCKISKVWLGFTRQESFFYSKSFQLSITTSFWNLFKRSTALSPDDAKTDQAFKGVVEKFEAHNYIHQVNKLEECYDSWLDYPLGEKKGIFCLETKV